MDYSYPRNPSYTVPMFGRGQAVARRRYMVRNEKNNFAALPSNTYSDSESRRVKRFLNSFHSPNSEFFEVKTQFQTGGGVSKSGPPFFCPDGQKNEAARLHFTVRSTTSLKSRRLFFTSSLPSCSALLVKPLPEVACEDVHYCGLCLALLALQAVLLRLNPLRSLVKFAR